MPVFVPFYTVELAMSYGQMDGMDGQMGAIGTLKVRALILQPREGRLDDRGHLPQGVNCSIDQAGSAGSAWSACVSWRCADGLVEFIRLEDAQFGLLSAQVLGDGVPIYHVPDDFVPAIDPHPEPFAWLRMDHISD